MEVCPKQQKRVQQYPRMALPLLSAHQSRENYISLTWYSQKNQEEVPRVIIATLSDYTLWHRRMGHTHQRVIKHLGKITWKVVQIKPLKRLMELVGDVKKESPRDFLSQLCDLGQNDH